MGLVRVLPSALQPSSNLQQVAHGEKPSSELIDSTDHLSAADIETPSIIEDAEAQTADTNDEQPVSDA